MKKRRNQIDRNNHHGFSRSITDKGTKPNIQNYLGNCKNSRNNTPRIGNPNLHCRPYTVRRILPAYTRRTYSRSNRSNKAYDLITKKTTSPTDVRLVVFLLFYCKSNSFFIGIFMVCTFCCNGQGVSFSLVKSII